MKTSESLQRAADALQERGWKRGEGWVRSRGQDGPVCAEGALQIGMDMIPEEPIWSIDEIISDFQATATYRAFHGYLERADALPYDGAPVWMWNDDRTNDQDGVIATFRAAADYYELRGE